jgi:hypothetical protein
MDRVRAAMMSGFVLLRGWRARTPLKACARSRDSRTARGAGSRSRWRMARTLYPTIGVVAPSLLGVVVATTPVTIDVNGHTGGPEGCINPERVFRLAWEAVEERMRRIGRPSDYPGDFVHYNGHRPHRALALTPPRPARPPMVPATEWGEARVQRRDRLGGVVHDYVLAA